MEVRIHDEALFVVPGTGALWSFDFGKTKRVIREAATEVSDPPFQVAQVRVDDLSLMVVFSTVGSASLADQDRVRTILREHVGNRSLAFVLEQAWGHVALVGSEREHVEHFAAAGAIVNACWGWDESPVITVAVDECEFAVTPKFDGEVWTARPELVSRRSIGRL